jgi:hypothetical protein
MVVLSGRGLMGAMSRRLSDLGGAEAALQVAVLAAWKRSVYCNINMAEESINLQTPYILMENLPGRPYPHPFTQLKAITDAQILKINAQLVGYSHQPSNITFDSIGQLVPRNGTQAEAVTLDNVCVGPIVDRKGRLYGPFSEAGEFYTTRALVVLPVPRLTYFGPPEGPPTISSSKEVRGSFVTAIIISRAIVI